MEECEKLGMRVDSLGRIKRVGLDSGRVLFLTPVPKCRTLATVVIGGLATSTLPTLLVLPRAYLSLRSRRAPPSIHPDRDG